jgi:hypothetical protein
MGNENVKPSSQVQGYLEAALAAEAAGRTTVAEELLSRAQRQERAEQLEGKRPVYWADGADLMTESRDGSGPCSVFRLESGKFDMAALAERLNEDDGSPLAPREGLTSSSRFVEDSEYVSREDPVTVFCGFSLASRVAEILNAEVVETLR